MSVPASPTRPTTDDASETRDSLVPGFCKPQDEGVRQNRDKERVGSKWQPAGQVKLGEGKFGFVPMVCSTSCVFMGGPAYRAQGMISSQVERSQ